MIKVDNNKIVIACQTCGYLIRDIIRAYRDSDYSVTLITAKASWETMKDDLPEDVECRYVIEYDRSTTIKRLFTWMLSTIQMLFIIAFCYRSYKVLYVSNPPFAPLLPLLLGNTYSLLIWDIYPDVLVSQKVFKEDSHIVKWWEKKNRKVFYRAEHVYTLSGGMKDCLAKYVSEDKIIIVPLWSDGTNLRRIEKCDNQFIKNNNLYNKFVVMYSGNMGNTHRMDVLVDVAKNISDKNVVFILIGEGAKKTMIEKRIADEGLDNMLLLPYQPYNFLSHSLSAADLAVITLDTASSQMSVPSKTLNMMSLGTPLMCIASPYSELGRMVKEYNIGDVFSPEDIGGMTNYINSLKDRNEFFNNYQYNSFKASRYFTSENAKMFVS